MPTNAVDTYDLLKRLTYVRVVDMADAMDGLGYFDIGLMDAEIRPLWLGMKWWGVAATQRCVPSNHPLWPLATTAEIVDAHGIWFRKMGNIGFKPGDVRQGTVIITSTGGAKEVGFWGSNNALGMVAQGAVGIVTDGYCRDTFEVTLQKTPICARRRGRTIIPGRIQTVEVQATVSCGGVQVRPGDLVGCDDDGILVVPYEIAAVVTTHAVAILIADMKGRRRLYEKLGMPYDETVDVDKVEAYHQQF
jgi:regulator of RNase E activity RraA